MLRTLGVLTAALILTSTAAAQQGAKQAGAPAKSSTQPIAWADLTGDWVGKAWRGTSDSLLTEVTTRFGADQKVWIIFPNREPEAARVVSMAGDSITVEVGPYNSVTRAGHTVTTRMTSHVANHKMWGTLSAKFDDGQSITGRTESVHKMK